jgi:hypothetical protein
VIHTPVPPGGSTALTVWVDSSHRAVRVSATQRYYMVDPSQPGGQCTVLPDGSSACPALNVYGQPPPHNSPYVQGDLTLTLGLSDFGFHHG